MNSIDFLHPGEALPQKIKTYVADPDLILIDPLYEKSWVAIMTLTEYIIGKQASSGPAFELFLKKRTPADSVAGPSNATSHEPTGVTVQPPVQQDIASKTPVNDEPVVEKEVEKEVTDATSEINLDETPPNSITDASAMPPPAGASSKAKRTRKQKEKTAVNDASATGTTGAKTPDPEIEAPQVATIDASSMPPATGGGSTAKRGRKRKAETALDDPSATASTTVEVRRSTRNREPAPAKVPLAK